MTNFGYSAQFYDKEVLKYPQPGLVARSVVIDANTVTLNTNVNQRTVLEAGTILQVSPLNSKQVSAYYGTDVAALVGVLSRSVDIITNATGGDRAAAAFFHEAIFATTQIVGFTAYSAHLATVFTTCKFM